MNARITAACGAAPGNSGRKAGGERRDCAPSERCEIATSRLSSPVPKRANKTPRPDTRPGNE